MCLYLMYLSKYVKRKYVCIKQGRKEKVAQNHLQMFYYHKKLGMYLVTLFQKMRRLEKASHSLFVTQIN